MKVLSIIISIMLIVIIALSLSLIKSRESIGIKEAELNERHERRIIAYNKQITLLTDKITTLQTERNNLRNEKAKTRIITITEIDSVALLPFDQQYIFISDGLSSLDSIKRRHFSGL